METSTIKIHQIPRIVNLTLDEISEKVSWPNEMKGIYVYHAEDRSHPVWVVISNGKLSHEPVWIDTVTGTAPLDGFLAVEPNGELTLKLMKCASYRLGYIGGGSVLSLIDSRLFQTDDILYIGKYTCLGILSIFPISIFLLLYFTGVFTRPLLK